MDKLDRLGWVVQHSYEIGGIRFAVRTTSHAFGEAIQEVLSEYQIEDEIYPWYSLIVAEDTKKKRSGKELNILYRGGSAILRTLDPDTFVGALLWDLESFLFPDREDGLFTEAVLVSTNGTKALIPSALLPSFAELGRRVDQEGLSIPLSTSAVIDPTDGRVIPMKQRLRLAPGAAERLSGAIPVQGRDGRSSLAEPTRVDHVFILGWHEEEEAVVPTSRGLVLSRYASVTRNLEKLGAVALTGLENLVTGARTYQIRWVDAREGLRALVACLRQA